VAVDALAVTVDVIHERGELVMSFSTDVYEQVLGPIRQGQGYIDLPIGPLVLAPGNYYVAVRFADPSGLHVYDRMERCAPFVVRTHSTRQPRGIVAVPARFADAQPHPLRLAQRSLDDRPRPEVEDVDHGARQ
jgi:hypothetical protein